MNVGTARRCDDRIDEALYAFARAAALGANTADFYYNVALAHIGRDDYEAARSLLQKALKLAPDDAEVRYRYAFCCYETLRTDEALATLDGWEALAAAPGCLGQRRPPHDEARRHRPGGTDGAQCRPARRCRPARHADPRATARTDQPDRGSSRSYSMRLKAEPADARLGSEIMVTEAQLAQRESRHETAVTLFREIVGDCKEVHLRHFQLFPLARSLDALGRYNEAFEALTAGPRLANCLFSSIDAARRQLGRAASHRRSTPVIPTTLLFGSTRVAPAAAAKSDLHRRLSALRDHAVGNGIGRASAAEVDRRTAVPAERT